MKMNIIINIYRYGNCVKHHFQHYSVISWRLVVLVEETEKTADLS